MSQRRTALNIKSSDQWEAFLLQCSAQLRTDVKERATPEEWFGDRIESQPSLLAPLGRPPPEALVQPEAMPLDEAVTVLNRALASGDAATVMDTLGGIARDRGMSQVARDTGLARESLYRSLDAGGNPEFATILKVLSSIGLHLEAKVGADSAQHIPQRRKIAMLPMILRNGTSVFDHRSCWPGDRLGVPAP